jgi:hypothetical protein
MKRKLLIETPVCPWEHLVIIGYTTGLSFASERIGPLAAIIITAFYLLALYLFALPNTPENLFASIYSESLTKTTCQHLLLLVGFDTLIYRKYYDTHPILVGHQCPPFCLRSFCGEDSCSLVGGVWTWLASCSSFASVDLVEARPLSAKWPLERYCHLRWLWLSSVDIVMRSQPFGRSRSSCLSAMEIPGTPAGRQCCPWHTPEVIPTTKNERGGNMSKQK